MGLADRLKDLTAKATDAAVEHREQIHGAVEKVAASAEQRTGGKYREHIQKAGAKADSLLDGLTAKQQPAADPAAGAGANAAETGEEQPDR